MVLCIYFSSIYCFVPEKNKKDPLLQTDASGHRHYRRECRQSPTSIPAHSPATTSAHSSFYGRCFCVSLFHHNLFPPVLHSRIWSFTVASQPPPMAVSSSFAADLRPSSTRSSSGIHPRRTGDILLHQAATRGRRHLLASVSQSRRHSPFSPAVSNQAATVSPTH